MKRAYSTPTIDLIRSQYLMDDTTPDPNGFADIASVHNAYGDGPQLGKEMDFDDEGWDDDFEQQIYHHNLWEEGI